MGSDSLLKRCFREPISEIFDSARYLDAAVSAHLSGHPELAAQLFFAANDKHVWDWTDSVWGKNSPYVTVNKQPSLHTVTRSKARMPDSEMKRLLHERDGYHCRFCGIPVIRAEVRKLLHKAYPTDIPWGRTNASQHAGFQCMWLQSVSYTHLTLPTTSRV